MTIRRTAILSATLDEAAVQLAMIGSWDALNRHRLPTGSLSGLHGAKNNTVGGDRGPAPVRWARETCFPGMGSLAWACGARKHPATPSSATTSAPV